MRLLGRLGPRFGEAAALRRRSVNLLTKRLTIEESIAEVCGRLVFGPTKTHAMRKFPLPPSLAADFKRHLENGVGLEPDALVFTSPTGTPLRYRNFMRRVWRPILEGLELPDVGVHVLRHSAAAALIQSGASATAVQKILGHRSAAFTLTVYGHIFDTDLDLVAEKPDQRSTWTVELFLHETRPGRRSAYRAREQLAAMLITADRNYAVDDCC